MKTTKSTGARLREWREASALTQSQAAGVFGCTEAAYRKWEANEVSPTGAGLIYRKRVGRVLERFEENR